MIAISKMIKRCFGGVNLLPTETGLVSSPGSEKFVGASLSADYKQVPKKSSLPKRCCVK